MTRRPEASFDVNDGTVEIGWRVKSSEHGQNTRAVLVNLDGVGDSTDEENQEQTAMAEVAHNVGIIYRPKISRDTEAVVVRSGDDVIVLAVLDKSNLPEAIAEGEIAIYSPTFPECRIVMKADGSIAAFTKSGQSVKINNGTSPVAHEGSATAGHTHTISGTAGPYAISAVASTSTDQIAVGAGSNDLQVNP